MKPLSHRMPRTARAGFLGCSLAAVLCGCASAGKPPPRIPLDEPAPAQPLPDPPSPIEVVEVEPK